jgi:Phosphotransferase enzyme family
MHSRFPDDLFAKAVRELRAGAGERRPERGSHVVRMLDTPSGDLAVKVFGSNGRGEARREWSALTILERLGHERSPRPIWQDLDHPLPALAMTRVPGVPLAGVPLSEDCLAALAAVLADVYQRVPQRVVRTLPPANGAAAALLEMLRRNLPIASDPAWSDPVREAHAAATSWLESGGCRRLAGPAPLVMGRGDPNLANFLWDGERLFHVDFEDSGARDVATELADLVEHLNARATPDRRWHDLVDRFDLDPAARARHLAARRVLAADWMARLLPGGPAERRNPPGTLERQATRLMELLG